MKTKIVGDLSRVGEVSFGFRCQSDKVFVRRLGWTTASVLVAMLLPGVPLHAQGAQQGSFQCAEPNDQKVRRAMFGSPRTRQPV
jgi:hypothetical protein